MNLLKQLLSFILILLVHAPSFLQQITFNKVIPPEGSFPGFVDGLEGTGLGLSLAYDTVKAHGGEMKVDTKEGEGTFIIELPLQS